MEKILKIILAIFCLAGTILWFMLPERAMPPAEAAESVPMGAMFYIAYILLGAAILMAVGFALKDLLANPAGLKMFLFVAGGFIIIFVISYVLASGTDVDDEFMAMSDESTVKYIGMGLNVFFILTAIAIGSLVVPSVKKMFVK